MLDHSKKHPPAKSGNSEKQSAGFILEIEDSIWQRYKRALFPNKKL